MARTTKLELEQQLIASQRDNAALRMELSTLRAELERAARTLQVGSEQEQANAAQRVYHATRPAQPTQRQLPAHFIAARELAMRTGRSVKVGA